MAKEYKDAKIEHIIKVLASEFLSRESNRQSLVTVTDVIFGYRSKSAKILISVMPDHKATAALDFAQRKRGELREYIKEKSKLSIIPFLSIELDIGEKNRQNVDNLI